jgi:hypothetical protein
MNMNGLLKTVAATTLLMSAGFATTASADASTMTCGSFMEQEDATQLESAHALLEWIADTANFESVASLEIYKMATEDDMADPSNTNAGWTDAEMVISITAHCFHFPAETNILERLKARI